MRRIYSVVCKCVSVIMCTCRDLISPKNEDTFSHRNFEEWKRIEGVDQCWMGYSSLGLSTPRVPHPNIKKRH